MNLLPKDEVQVRFWTVVFVAIIVLIDLTGAIFIRILIEEPPMVTGDVAKVGIGVLGGYLMAGFHHRNKDDGV